LLFRYIGVNMSTRVIIGIAQAVKTKQAIQPGVMTLLCFNDKVMAT